MESKETLYIIGDSISIHYGPYLDQIFKYSKEFKGILRLYPENTSSTDKVLELLNSDVRVFPNSLIIWNAGLHDVRHNREDNRIYTTMDDYIKNLELIYLKLKEKGFSQVFINSTPIYDERHNNRQTGWIRRDLDIKYYNEKAKETMDRLQVPVIDLYSFTKELGEAALFDHIHFKPQVRAEQAKFIAKELQRILGGPIE